MAGNFDVSSVLSTIQPYLIPALAALAVFVIGRWVAGRLGKGVERGLSRSPNSDATLNRFFGNLVKFAVLAITIIAALTVLGIETTSFAGVVLGLGAAMAFILQGSLSNLAAGVMMQIFRPFSIGDIVEAGGATGEVIELGLTATRLKTPDNTEIIVANGQIWGSTVSNHSSMGDRRIDMNFGVSYDADIESAITAITSAAAADSRSLSEPAPWAKVVNLGDSSVDIQLRVWCKASDYKALKAGLSQPVKAALDKAGIGIPYPHEVKIKQHVKSSKARDRIRKLSRLRQNA